MYFSPNLCCCKFVLYQGKLNNLQLLSPFCHQQMEDSEREKKKEREGVIEGRERGVKDREIMEKQTEIDQW